MRVQLSLVAAFFLPACADSVELSVADQSGAAIVTAEASDRLTSVRRLHDRIVGGGVDMALAVDLVVDGAGLARRVGVHASIDGGVWQDYPAVRTGGRNTATDVWTAMVGAGAPFDEIEYVVWAETDGQERVWSNASGSNWRATDGDPVRFAGHRWESGVLVVDLDVANLAYQKTCGAEVTSDDWASHRGFFDGRYIGPTERPNIERWQVRVVDASPGPALDRAAAIDYAVSCSFGGGSEQWWDNNHGGDFRFEVAPPPVVSWTRSFDAALDVELASDGTVFVLSTNDPPFGAAPGSRRWISIFDEYGSLRRVVTTEVDVARMVHLAVADVLLVELYNPDPAQHRWQALSRDGAVLWDRVVPAARVVATSGPAFLVGQGVVATLSAQPPTMRSCGGDPLVTAAGVAVCVEANGTRLIDVNGGNVVAMLPAGEPFAASDDALTIVIGTGASTDSSGYLSTLTAYRRDGSVIWQKTGLTLTPDHHWGAPRLVGDCSNRAFADRLAYADQPQSGADAAVVVLDVHSGAESARVPVVGGVIQPCPAEDGRFYWNHSYMRYGRWFDRVDGAGVTLHVDIGFHGQLESVAPSGGYSLRHKPYLGSNGAPAQPRLIVAGSAGELWTDFIGDGSESSPSLVDADDERAIVYADGHVSLLDF